MRIESISLSESSYIQLLNISIFLYIWEFQASLASYPVKSLKDYHYLAVNELLINTAAESTIIYKSSSNLFEF